MTRGWRAKLAVVVATRSWPWARGNPLALTNVHWVTPSPSRVATVWPLTIFARVSIGLALP